MNADKAVEHWQEMSRETMQGMARWREGHPKASLREIEKALDARITKLCAQVLEDAAQWSEMREWSQSTAVPVCSDCKQALEFRIKGKREMQTHGGQTIRLERD